MKKQKVKITQPVKKEKKLRIFFNSNAIFATSGYSNQIAELLPLIRDEDYPLAICNFYGSEGGKFMLDGILQYPKLNHVYGSDAIIHHAKDFQADIVFTLQDQWVLNPQDLQQVKNWIPIVPIDHDPVPQVIIDRLKFAYRVVTYSQFGQKELQRKGIHSTYIPHTVNTEIFKPMDKKALKKAAGLPEDCFLLGMVAANKDNPPRKSFQEVIDAFILFLQKAPNAYLYIHTNPEFPGGFPIREYGKFLGIQDRILFPDPYQMNFNMGKKEMALVYNAFDVLLAPSISEGFGVPIIEAQSCFVSGTKFSTDTLEEWMQKPYSGEIVTIETNKGNIECTPDHPFYTDKGWVRAGLLNNGYRLLHNNRYEEKGIHKGDIGKYSRIMGNTHNQGSISNIRSNLQLGSVDNTSREDQETLLSKTEDEKPTFIREAISLLSGSNRRRWANNNKKNEWWEMEASSFNNRWFRKANEISEGNDNDQFVLYREEKKRPLSISSSGDIISAILPEFTAIFNNKKGQTRISNQMERITTKSNEVRKDNARTEGDSNKDKTFEFAKIKNVRKRKVQDILVYNTKTRSNTYLANGFLVHNCGIPVIVNNFTSMPELVRQGVTGEVCDLVPDGNGKRFSPQLSYMGIPSVKSLFDCLMRIYNADREKMAEEARKWIIENYDTKKIFQSKWKPFLEKLEKEVYNTE